MSYKFEPSYRYLCAFKFKDVTCMTESLEGISAFKDGFWINGYLQITTKDDNKYWIPPSMILYIEKIK